MTPTATIESSSLPVRFSALRKSFIAQMRSRAQALYFPQAVFEENPVGILVRENQGTDYCFVTLPVREDGATIKKVKECFRGSRALFAQVFVFESAAHSGPWEKYGFTLAHEENHTIIPLAGLALRPRPAGESLALTTYADGYGAQLYAGAIGQANGHRADDLLKLSSALMAGGNDMRFYVVRRGEKPVAALAQVISGETALVWQAAVLPECEHQGVKTWLLTTALQEAKSLGCAAALLKEGESLPAELHGPGRTLPATLRMYQWSYNADYTILPDRQMPSPYPPSGVLLQRADYEAACAELEGLALPRHTDQVKNWDSLAALSAIVRSTGPEGKILDAGGEYYSVILPQLAAYGYRNLECINLGFSCSGRKGPIHYAYGDITRTRFPNADFDAITCLSVVEHGVDWNAYFAEMARVLKPGGILFTSTDYWSTPIDTAGKTAYGTPVKIFSPVDISDAVRLAGEHGLQLIEPIAFATRDQVVEWQQLGLRYTFMYFTLRKKQ